MNEWIYLGDATPFPTDLQTMVLSLLLAFLTGQLLAWVYMFTHSGLSYSRSFVSSLIILPMTVATVMMVLDNNLVTAFSLMAVFAIVRFRNIVRDTLDTVYLLSVIVVGMACGTQKLSTALVGAVLAALALLYLWYTSFGSRQRYDMIVNLTWSDGANGAGGFAPLERVFERHALLATCASERTSGTGEVTDLSYRLLLRDPARSGELLNELRGQAGVSRVTSVRAQDESEV
jgi:hypothetical protein